MKLGRSLRRLAGLPWLSLWAPPLALLALAVGCDGNLGDECDVTRATKTFVVELPAPPVDALKVDRCRLDAEACTALCLKEFEVSDGTFLADVEECKVVFFDDHVYVAFRYRRAECDFADAF